MATNLSTEQRSRLAEIIDAKSSSGETLLAREITQEFCDFLREEARNGRLENHLYVLAEAATKEVLKARQWDIDGSQLSLYKPHALLTIADGEYIPMERAKAEHCVKHLTILTTNHNRQNAAFGRKALYLQERIGALYAQDCTLGDLERVAELVAA
jgi:hypothetical protein